MFHNDILNPSDFVFHTFTWKDFWEAGKFVMFEAELQEGAKWQNTKWTSGEGLRASTCKKIVEADPISMEQPASNFFVTIKHFAGSSTKNTKPVLFHQVFHQTDCYKTICSMAALILRVNQLLPWSSARFRGTSHSCEESFAIFWLPRICGRSLSIAALLE